MDRHEIKASEMQVGDRLDPSGRIRVANIHPKKDDRVLAQTKVRGARSANIQSWHPETTVKVWR